VMSACVDVDECSGYITGNLLAYEQLHGIELQLTSSILLMEKPCKRTCKIG
jgi:hypothetical protein